MIAQLYFVLDQTEGTKKAFLEWKSTDLYSNYLLNVGVMLAIVKVFINLFLLCLWE